MWPAHGWQHGRTDDTVPDVEAEARWLLVERRTDGSIRYALSNLPATATLEPVGCAEGRAYLSYQPSRKARPRVQPHTWYISQAGVASLSISIFSASRARAAKM